MRYVVDTIQGGKAFVQFMDADQLLAMAFIGEREYGATIEGNSRFGVIHFPKDGARVYYSELKERD